MSAYLMYLLIVFLPLLGSSVAGFFGRFLGSEGTAIMTTNTNLVLFAILILGFIFFYRRVCLRLKTKHGFRLVLVQFLYLSCLLLISLFGYVLRIYLVESLSLHFGHLFPFLLVLCVGEGLPLPAPSDPSNSSSWTEDSFEIRVLSEPFSETELEGTSGNPPITRVAGEEAGPSRQTRGINPYTGLETSLKNRIQILENQKSIFLLDKERGLYWNEVQTALEQAPSQEEYNRLIDFENRDLQIRELKHACHSIYSQVLNEHPGFAENSPDPDPNPEEAILDFFDAIWEELDAHPEWDTEERDRIEILFLNKVSRDMRERGPDSIYIRVMLGYEHNQ